MRQRARAPTRRQPVPLVTSSSLPLGLWPRLPLCHWHHRSDETAVVVTTSDPTRADRRPPLHPSYGIDGDGGVVPGAPSRPTQLSHCWSGDWPSAGAGSEPSPTTTPVDDGATSTGAGTTGVGSGSER